MLVQFWIASLLVTGLVSPQPVGPAPRTKPFAVPQVSGTGVITGMVTLAGRVPVPKALDITIDHEVCGKEPGYEEDLVVVRETRGLRNVVVWLRDVREEVNRKLNHEPPTLDQKGCRFTPHVLVVAAGEAVTILNSDGILHNIHTRSSINRQINKAQPGILKRVSVKFRDPEIIRVDCDAHDWMRAWIVVAAHPYYAVTGEDGRYRLDDVPPGTYTLEFWHETLGNLTRQVVVSGEKEVRIDVQYALR